MGKTLDQLASAVLRDVEVLEDSANTQALTDCKNYINERANDIYRRRTWGEYVVLGSFAVPASTYFIRPSDVVLDAGFPAGNGRAATLSEFTSVRKGDVPLIAEDQGAINLTLASLWTSTTEPFKYVNLGQKGVRLLGYYSSETTLSFFGKAGFQDLTASETWIMDEDGKALIKGAAADMMKYHDRDDNRANALYGEYEAEIAKLVDAAEVQRGNVKRLIPLFPHTDQYNRFQMDTTKTGAGNYW